MKSRALWVVAKLAVIFLIVLSGVVPVCAQFGKNSQFFAQYAINGGTESEFTVHNPGDSFLNVELSLFSSDGQVVSEQTIGLTAGASKAVVLGGADGAPEDGWALLNATRAFAASLYYRIPGVGTVGVLPSSPTTRARLLPAGVAEAGIGLAVANPGAVAAELTFRIISVFGQINREEEMMLGAGEHFALFASQAPIEAQPGEAVEVVSNVPIIATALRLEDGFLSGAGLILPELPIRAEYNGGTPNLIGGHENNGLTLPVKGATIAGGGSSGGPNRIADEYSTVGGGTGNLAGSDDSTEDNAAFSTVAGGSSNTSAGFASTIGGGSQNEALDDYATVAGGTQNVANQEFSFVGGGTSNQASGRFAGVAAGHLNQANGGDAFVGGGAENVAGATRSTVCGGYRNEATALFSVVCGGNTNNATANGASIFGGANNEASGISSTIVGGSSNTSSGNHSFAAGQRSVAQHDGAFVWSGLSQTEIQSSTADEFTIRAQGGVRLFSNDDATTGVMLEQGGGSWMMVSDRNLKRDFDTVDSQSVLRRLSQIPMTSWSYKSQDGSVRHVGPMAQDFYAAFGLGSDERKIATVDGIGISLAAIQGLQQQLEEKEARIQRLEMLLEEVLERIP